MALLNIIIPTDNPARDTLIVDFFSTTTYSFSSQVINDQQLGLQIVPVVANPSGTVSIWAPDSEPTDSYQLGIGLASQTATGGTFKLTVNGSSTGLTALAYNISAASLQTPLSAAFVAQGKAAGVTVTLVSAGAYRVLYNGVGAIATGFLVGDGTNLAPDGTSAFVIEEDLGSVSTPFQYLILERQSPMAYCEPATPLPTAGVTLTTTAAGSSTSDRIQRISYDAPSTYDGSFNITCSAGAAKPITAISIANPTHVTLAAHGFPNGATVVIAGSNSSPSINGSQVVTVLDDDTFTVAVNVTVAGTQGTAQYTENTTCGIATVQTGSGGLMTAQQLGVILASHPQIYYQEPDGTPDNIIPTQNGQDYFVQFTGTLGNSSAPSLTVTDIDLIAPEGVSGALNLNTIPLNEYAFSQTGTTFDLLISIVRTRSSGEVRTIFGPTSITIAKDILDPTSMVPPGLASYLTIAQANALYARLASANIFTAAQTLSPGSAGFDNALVINADAAQSVDLVEVFDAGSSLQVSISANGSMTLGLPLTVTSGINGVATNSTASSGIVGEFVSSLIPTGSATALTTATAKTITSISLGAGDWDVEGNVNFNLSTATQTQSSAGISLTTNVLPTDGSEVASGIQTTTASTVNGITLPRKRVSIATTTTVYLVAKSTFTGTESGWGGLTARRVR